MKKPSGIVEQVWDFRVLRHKAYEAHKAYDKARDKHERAIDKWHDIPRLDQDQEDDEEYKNNEIYETVKDTKRNMDQACEIMAEAYCDYINHKRTMRERK